MRMDPTDVSDVTGAAYTYLVNGHGPFDNWTALFTPGERVRLRIINASSMTTFNVRIPELPMTVVQADGQHVQPVETDELQIGVAETYDVIVTPASERAFTFIGEAVDRSGMARATLAPRVGMTAAVPPLRRRPVATMRDMGMDMDMGGRGGSMSMGSSSRRGIDTTAEQNASRLLATSTEPAGPGGPSQRATAGTPGAARGAMNHGTMAGMQGMDMPSTGATAPQGAMSGMEHGGAMAGMDHTGASGSAGEMSSGSMQMRDFSRAPTVARNPGVQTISPMPMDRTADFGQGLEETGHRVLVYQDLVALERNPDVRAPSRSVDVHLTGNMERYMWSMDGRKMSDTMEPIPFRQGERVRVNLINDTMMTHPIHLHGHFFELVTGHGDHAPRKHTVNVQPGGRVSFDLTADNPGDWAFHCHVLFHMTAGMMRIVSVRPERAAA